MKSKGKSRVYLGSKNPAKVDAVMEVFNGFQLVTFAVDSGVSSQPKSDEETIRGALNRARSLPADGLRVGLEGGLEIHNDMLFLVNWGVLIDKMENIYYAGGTRIPLPSKFKKPLLNGKKELSELIDEYTNQKDIRSNEGTIGIFTNNLVVRKDIFVHICKLLYGQFLYKKGGN